jgi:hypothetical protein
MKTFKVNKSSWHYKLNAYMLSSNDIIKGREHLYLSTRDNLCKYWQTTLWSLAKVLITAIAIAVALFLFGILAYLAGYAFFTEPLASTIFTGSILGISALIIGTIYGIEMLVRANKRKARAALYAQENESLTKAKIASWKAGICLPVEFKE